MKEQLISFDTAKLAKEKGIGIDGLSVEFRGYFVDRDCQIWQPGIPDFWKDNIKKGIYFKTFPELVERHLWRDILIGRPTQSLLQKWLREVHHIHIEVIYDCGPYGYNVFDEQDANPKAWDSEIKTYEKTLESALQAALKLIES